MSYLSPGRKALGLGIGTVLAAMAALIIVACSEQAPTDILDVPAGAPSPTSALNPDPHFRPTKKPDGPARASNLGQPVPASVIVVHNGLEWVWASPCTPPPDGCTTGINVGHDGFNFATESQWALRPPVSAFGAPVSGNIPDKCAAPWFDHSWDHCDYADAEAGFYGSSPNWQVGPNGGARHPNAETWLVRGEGGGTTEPVGPEGGTVTVEENGKTVAGTEIPPGTFNETVNVTVRFEELEEGEQCHGTLAGQTGRCLEITAKTQSGGDAELNNPIIVGFCPPLGVQTGRGFFKFDETGTPVALKEVDWDVISEADCAGFASAAGSSWLKGFASGLVNRVGRWFGPEPLRAAMFNRGYGHETPGDDKGLSHFTWASEIQVSNAGLAVNVKNSGKDAFGVAGTFDLAGAAFSPTVHAVTVSFGDGGPALNAGGDDVVQTLSKTRCATSSSRNCWRLNSGWWVWFPPSGTSTGVLAMSIKNDLSGKFATGGLVPNTGLASGTPTFRAFALQISERTQGVGLECDAQGACKPHPDVHP